MIHWSNKWRKNLSSKDTIKRIFKYQENGLNNLKRIYAVVLSISFGDLLRSLYSSFESMKTSDFFIQSLFSVILFSTAWVFYFQEDKLLDISLGSDPSDSLSDSIDQGNKVGGTFLQPPYRWLPITLAVYFGCVMSTLVIFVFMSLADSRLPNMPIQKRNFLFFYVTLLFVGTTFSLIHRAYDIYIARSKYRVNLFGSLEIFGNEIDGRRPLRRYVYQARIAHSLGLMSNWLFVNGLTVIVILLCVKYDLHFHIWKSCKIWAVLVLTVISILRNIFDYMGTWPFLFINDTAFRNDEVKVPSWTYLVVKVAKKPENPESKKSTVILIAVMFLIPSIIFLVAACLWFDCLYNFGIALKKSWPFVGWVQRQVQW